MVKLPLLKRQCFDKRKIIRTCLITSNRNDKRLSCDFTLSCSFLFKMHNYIFYCKKISCCGVEDCHIAYRVLYTGQCVSWENLFIKDGRSRCMQHYANVRTLIASRCKTINNTVSVNITVTFLCGRLLVSYVSLSLL